MNTPNPLHDLILRCMVYPAKSGQLTAECIDLDIIVEGRTAHQALHELKMATIGYLNVVFDGDPAGLIPRPSPVSHRLRYHLLALRAAFSTTRRNFLISDWSPDTSRNLSLCK